jgi:hypothetical protein
MNRICSTLADAGADVWLIGRLKKDSIALTDKPYQQTRLNCIFQSGKLFYIEFNIRLFFYLIFQNFDKLCSIDLDTVLPGLAVCKLKNKKHFYDAHEMFPYVPEVISRPNVQKFWMWVEKLTFKYSNSVYTVGGAIADWFQNKYNKKSATSFKYKCAQICHIHVSFACNQQLARCRLTILGSPVQSSV